MERFKPFVFILLCLVLTSVFLACGVPDDKRVASDFREVFAKEAGPGLTPVITSSGPGEGDSDNVYKHVKFDVSVNKDVDLPTGWFAGRSLKHGQKLIDGEAVLLYQKDKSSQWKMTQYELKRLPQ